jgi:hypothetical protein
LPEAFPEGEVLLLLVEVVQGWVNSQGGSFSCLVGVGWGDCLDGFGLGLGLGAMVVDALGMGREGWRWDILYTSIPLLYIVSEVSQLNRIKNC